MLRSRDQCDRHAFIGAEARASHRGIFDLPRRRAFSARAMPACRPASVPAQFCFFLSFHPPHELGPASKSTLSTSSLAFLRAAASSLSEIGSALKLPQDC